jgi:hypothetical protein
VKREGWISSKEKRGRKLIEDRYTRDRKESKKERKEKKRKKRTKEKRAR